MLEVFRIDYNNVTGLFVFHSVSLIRSRRMRPSSEANDAYCIFLHFRKIYKIFPFFVFYSFFGFPPTLHLRIMFNDANEVGVYPPL